MNSAKMLLLGLVFLTGLPFSSGAEPDQAPTAAMMEMVKDHPQWQATVDRFTGQSRAIKTENEKLTSEYEFLQGKISGLKSDVEKTRHELKKLKAGGLPSGKPSVDSTGAVSQMDDLQKEIDEVSRQNKELESQLADLQEKNRLWKVKYSDMESQKREANIDKKYEQALAGEAVSGQDKTMTELQAQLDKSLQNEKGLSEALARITAQNANFPTETGNLKKKIRDMEDHLKLVKKQISEQKRENEKIRKSAQKGKSTTKGKNADLENEIRALHVEVDKLTAQLDAVSKTVGESKEILDRKRKLMDQIMHLDAENQELRARIESLAPQMSK